MKIKLKKIIKKIEYKDLILFLIPFVVFLGILFVFYPGILTFDSYNQLNQITVGKFESWHPFIHTFIEMICMKVWNTPASVALLQIFIFSFIWTAVCKYNRKNDSKLLFFLQIVITLIIVLNPINSIYAITLWKDTLFTYAILLLCFIIEIMIDRKFNLSKFFVINLGMLMAFISKIRFNGIVLIIFLILIMIIVLIKKKKYKILLLLIISYISSMTILFCLDKVYDVEDNSKSALNTKIMHIIGYYETEGFFNEEDNKIISKIIEINELEESYNPYFLDPIYSNSDQQAATKNRKKLIKMIVRESFNHPDKFFEYAFKSSSMTWEIVRPDDAIGVVLWLNIESSNNEKNIKAIHKNTNYYKKIYEAIDSSTKNKISATLLYSPSLYMYLSLIICFTLCILMKNLKLVLIILPNLINSLVIFASTPLQDIRYIYPNFMIFYLMLIIFIKYLFDKRKDLST